MIPLRFFRCLTIVLLRRAKTRSTAGDGCFYFRDANFPSKNAPAGAFFIDAASSALSGGQSAAGEDEHAADKEGETQPSGDGAPIF